MPPRTLTDDELIHVPLPYLTTYGDRVPAEVPPLTPGNAAAALRALVQRGRVAPLPSVTDRLAAALCGAGFWEWSAGAHPPTFRHLELFIREHPALAPLARQPHARGVFQEMVRLEFEARRALAPQTSGPPAGR